MSARKILVIFELEKVICRTQRVLANFRKSNQYMQQISSPQSELERKYKIQYRPGYEDLLKFLFLQGRDTFEVGVWSSLGREECTDLCNLTLRKHMPSLLFITATKGSDPTRASLTEDINVVPIAKDLRVLSEQFPEFTTQNTFCVSPFENLHLDHSINDIFVPQYAKTKLGVDMADDYYMYSLQKFLSGMREVWKTNKTKDVRRYIVSVNYKVLHEKMESSVNAQFDYR
jgi:hypothetical protein